jgi:Fe-S oxidoreductase
MESHFDPFVIPFSSGLIFLLGIIIIKFIRWFINLSSLEKKLFNRGFFSFKFFSATWEVFMESLIHRKMFRSKPLMGYMHMTFALGWFLLIAIGNLESRLHNLTSLNWPYFPIFFKFFIHENPHVLPGLFSFVMDFILLMVLSGVVLAIIKRFYSRFFGIKKLTRHSAIDRLAMYSLWCIFPLRFLAESLSAASYHAGGFATNPFGAFLGSFLPVQTLTYPAWWAYSFSLGIFFVTLPWSRYLHIPAEVLLVYAKHFGFKSEKTKNNFTILEVSSCPRCGLCIDACQLNFSAGITDTQPAYFIRSIREGAVREDKAFNCMICGRCLEACPVGIETNNIRLQQRTLMADDYLSDFSFLPSQEVKKAEVVYFAGCMTHLTPSIKKSVIKILDVAGIDYLFLDQDASICCGRPVMLSGNIESANNLILYNKTLIQKSGAKTLVTSCPICYKVFNSDYGLDIEILHHSQFILRLAEENKIELVKKDLRVAFHDPCELGRNSGIYDQPRSLLKKSVDLSVVMAEREKALCCGGSMGLFSVTNDQRDSILTDLVMELSADNPDLIATACPLCKKTISRASSIPVKDISEIVVQMLVSADVLTS